MTAGIYNAGLEAAGEELLPAPTRRTRATPPRALLFDGATRTFLRDATGRYRDIHPIDQKVALTLLMEFGKITAAPDIGNTLLEIRTLIPGEALTTDVERRLRTPVLSGLITAGDIREITTPTRGTGFTIILPHRGALEVKFDYENMRDPKRAPGRARTVTLRTGQ